MTYEFGEGRAEPEIGRLENAVVRTSFNADVNITAEEWAATPTMPEARWDGMTAEEVMADVNKVLEDVYLHSTAAPEVMLLPLTTYYGVLMYPLYRLLQRGRRVRRPSFAVRVLSRRWRGTAREDRAWLAAYKDGGWLPEL